jgi:phage shock protein A
LRKRLANLIDAYEAANNQLDSTLSAVDRTRLKKQIKDLEQEISEVESELESLQ